MTLQQSLSSAGTNPAIIWEASYGIEHEGLNEAMAQRRMTLSKGASRAEWPAT